MMLGLSTLDLLTDGQLLIRLLVLLTSLVTYCTNNKKTLLVYAFTYSLEVCNPSPPT